MLNNTQHNVIPPMTHKLGKYWNQPDPSRILLDDTHAVMDAATFKGLSDYSMTLPTGMYGGKMWRAFNGGAWVLLWAAPEQDPDGSWESTVRIERRLILVVGEVTRG